MAEGHHQRGLSHGGDAGGLAVLCRSGRCSGLLGAISRKFGDHKVEFEVSRSSEEDYLSHGFALSDEWELNEKEYDGQLRVQLPG